MKPMLSHTITDTSAVKYPVLVSQKLDGIRCLIIDGVAASRNFKPIRNEYVQTIIGMPEYGGLDGELIVGNPFAKDCYRVTNSGVMSKDGEPDFTFHVFDRWDMPGVGFSDRLAATQGGYRIQRVPHHWAYCEADLLRIEEVLLAKGAEGVMVRSLDGTYKYGRSTMKEGTLGKLKRFSEDDFLVVDFEERFHNANPATVNALGHTERSMHVENMIGRGDLGALVLETSEGKRFTAGSGFDDATRREIWGNKEKYVGRWAKIKHFPVGVKTLPRFPTFLGFRDENDMS